MRIQSLVLVVALAAAVAGCTQPGSPGPLQTQGGRAVAGAVVGAAIADATDRNMVAGAALGALAGGASCGVPGLPACY
ncbi:MAG: hypothetical protein LBE86_09575 [Gemmobacter sp.]|jgi:hypothetical protein|nr:hypothetical protein [Gemmobacter sp.]